MEDVFDFLWAALPWIAVGLLLAVFFARSAKKKKAEEQTGDYGTEGMCYVPWHRNRNLTWEQHRHWYLPRYADRSGNRNLYQKGGSRRGQ